MRRHALKQHVKNNRRKFGTMDSLDTVLKVHAPLLPGGIEERYKKISSQAIEQALYVYDKDLNVRMVTQIKMNAAQISEVGVYRTSGKTLNDYDEEELVQVLVKYCYAVTRYIWALGWAAVTVIWDEKQGRHIRLEQI